MMHGNSNIKFSEILLGSRGGGDVAYHCGCHNRFVSLI